MGDVGADSGVKPIALKISSFGEVAISLSSGVIVLFGTWASLGTARSIVPVGSGTSTLPDSVHLLLLARPIELDPVGEGVPNTILFPDITNACVVCTGDSVPLRLNMETLRLKLFELGS